MNALPMAAETDTVPVLRARGLVKRYGALLATDGVTLDLMPGEIHALIGPNGAGKSTLIHLLAGTTKADAGSLWVAGRDVTHASVRQRVRAGLSRSYQITNIFQGMSVLDNLLLAVQACNGSSFSLWRPRARDSALYDQARLLAADCTIDAALFSRAAGTLPHGEQRKLEFALALASRPTVLLLDEPMAGMGPDETARLTDLIEGLRGRAAMLLVEHDMDAVFRLADRISVLVYGQIIATGTPAEIRASAAVREAYLGESESPVAGDLQDDALSAGAMSC
jgi:branched-chain amino acid transport system ATP-binding protein